MNKKGLLAVLLVFMLVFSSIAVYADGHMDEENGNDVEMEENGDVEENEEAVENGDDDEATDEEMDDEADVEEEEEVDEEIEEEEVEETVAAEKIQLQLDNINAIIDGEEVIEMDLAPFVDENNRTLVPFRFLSEQFGAEVEWDGEARTVTYVTEETTMVLTIDSSVAMVNGEEVELDSAPIIHAESERTVVPLRFVSESMGYDVEWVEETRTIVITAPVEEEAVEEEEEMDDEEAVEEDVDEEEEEAEEDEAVENGEDDEAEDEEVVEDENDDEEDEY